MTIALRRDQWSPGGHGPCASAETAEALSPSAAAAPDLLSDEEIIVLMLKPSGLYVLLSSLGFIFATSFIAVLLTLFAPWIQGAGFAWSEADAVTFAVALIGLRLIWQTVDWWNQTYILTDRRVLAISGVCRRRVFEAPLRNIQHIAVVVSLRERLFRLGSIAFAAKGSHTYEAAWLMIREPREVHQKVIDTIDRYGRNHPT